MHGTRARLHKFVKENVNSSPLAVLTHAPTLHITRYSENNAYGYCANDSPRRDAQSLPVENSVYPPHFKSKQASYAK
jgi:hypothetical protein